MEKVDCTHEPYKIQVLIAVWGENYIKDFLRLSLPSLIAPGNLPSLANCYDTKIVFLAADDSEKFFLTHKVFKKLQSICPIEFISISDLILHDKYSITLTLAYDRAIKNTGNDILNTYFIFLTSDYIMANGSLTGLMKYINKGYSGICSGNFQAVKETAEDYLIKKINPSTLDLTIDPRDLLKFSFKHIHPLVFTSMQKQKIVSNYQINRFFIRHDQDVLAGRFFLLHMLCIKPEVYNYEISAPCDYSFIPEMCPSKNIAIITDSDDYCVIEMQSRNHESRNIKSEPYNLKKLSKALAEWTTKQHRENANHTIYFHSRDISIEEKKIIEDNLNKFIKIDLKKINKYKEQPHFNHIHWTKAILDFKFEQKILSEQSHYQYIEKASDNNLYKKFYRLIYNLLPLTHHRWKEYNLVMDTFQYYIGSYAADQIAVFYDSHEDDFSYYFSWMKKSLNINNHYYMPMLLDSTNRINLNQFSLCILMIKVDHLIKIKKTLKLISSLLKNNGKLIIYIPNMKNHQPTTVYDFITEFVTRVNFITDSPFYLLDTSTIHNNLTKTGQSIIKKIYSLLYAHKKLRMMRYFLFIITFSPLFFIINYFKKFIKKNNGYCTNIFLHLKPEKIAK